MQYVEGGCNNMTRKKKAAIIAGIMMGVSAIMLPTAKTTQAAVAVFDAENIAKAVEIVTQTLNIYNNVAQQLGLQKINMAKLNTNIWGNILNQQQKAQTASSDTGWDGSHSDRDAEVLKSMGMTAGILNKTTTPEQILKNEIGDVSKIFKQGEIPTSYLSAQNSAKALDASYTDAAQTAQNIQRSDAMIAESVNQALSATTNAQGDMEIQQSLAAMQAANVQATQNGNQLLAQLLATQAQTGYAATYEKAITAQQEENSKQKLKDWISNW